jgi:hypothetical protein
LILNEINNLNTLYNLWINARTYIPIKIEYRKVTSSFREDERIAMLRCDVCPCLERWFFYIFFLPLYFIMVGFQRTGHFIMVGLILIDIKMCLTSNRNQLAFDSHMLFGNEKEHALNNRACSLSRRTARMKYPFGLFSFAEYSETTSRSLHSSYDCRVLFKGRHATLMNSALSGIGDDETTQNYWHYRQKQVQPCSDTALIDVRSSKDFESGHVVGATSIPIDELSHRLYELPPPFEEPVGIFASDTAQLSLARQILEGHRWSIDREILHVATGSYSTGISSRPVWKPNELLDDFLKGDRGKAWYSTRSSGVALDIGCGAGRDAVLMARILGPGWRVIGVDNDAGMRSQRPSEPIERIHALHG